MLQQNRWSGIRTTPSVMHRLFRRVKVRKGFQSLSFFLHSVNFCHFLLVPASPLYTQWKFMCNSSVTLWISSRLPENVCFSAHTDYCVSRLCDGCFFTLPGVWLFATAINTFAFGSGILRPLVSQSVSQMASMPVCLIWRRLWRAASCSDLNC